MSVKKSRRNYTREFKLEAVQLVGSRGGQVTRVADGLGIHPAILQRWLREYKDDPGYSFPGNGRMRRSVS